MDSYKLINFKEIGDSRGKLVAIEGSKDIPFEIKRIFYIYSADKNIIRGQHANLNSEFVMVNLSGSCKVKVFDGYESEEITLNKPMQGLYLPKMLWKDMYDFTDDAILLVLCNTEYDSNEYIKNIDEYIKIVGEKYGK